MPMSDQEENKFKRPVRTILTNIFDISADFIALYGSIKCGEIFAHKYKINMLSSFFSRTRRTNRMVAENLRFQAQHATKRLPQLLDVMIIKWNDKRLSHNVGFRFSTDNRALGELYC